MDATTGLSGMSPRFRNETRRHPRDLAGPANSLGTPLNNVEHFRYHRSSDEKLSLEKREAALVQIMGVRPLPAVRISRNRLLIVLPMPCDRNH